MGETTARATPLDTSTAEELVRPRAALVRSTGLSIGFSALPIAVAVVWSAVPTGLGAVVAAVVLLLAAVVAAAYLRLRTAFVAVHQDSVTIRGVLTGTRTVARSRVHDVLLVTRHGASAERASRDLVALDPAGEALFRVRGDVWGDDGVERLVDRFDVRTERLPGTMSAREFSRRWPRLRHWYERPAAAVLVGGAAVLTVGGLLVAETVGLVRK
ncbi:hypothetical protein DEJ16_11015 [Curtobacterium sp. MCJR17_055]|uniref:hypothetical protein n=1 Tax=unclassified Curtobacterium TaxID=257496 RepID=UPI000D925BBF|nr:MULTISPECIES: hypothetical protein [unclassified Curtobacterium]PYY36063.1 hypothetical protein DEI87_05850 [Curtobacterium sp. MCBD17_029]PYY54835.1 hypothetical protein DEJ16_11015 [Curtobacterium sp. MCJR17_055]PYY61071.1 hypothetical protein DEJ26_04165 [Curtobacterium sp. MCPF17_015]WIB35342.1 hypothetical protein DEJ15_13725 [Curtobacterium sp. MCJR17_043]